MNTRKHFIINDMRTRNITQKDQYQAMRTDRKHQGSPVTEKLTTPLKLIQAATKWIEA